MLGIAQCSFRAKRTDFQVPKRRCKAVPQVPLSLGDIIAVHRRSKGWRRGDLAAKANVPKATVREWENDASRPDSHLLALIGDWLAIPANLLSLDGAPGWINGANRLE